MLTDITAKYVDTLMREGKNFDYLKWFETLREEEALTKQLPAAYPSDKPVSVEASNPTVTSDRQDARIDSTPAVASKTAPIARTLFRSRSGACTEPTETNSIAFFKSSN